MDLRQIAADLLPYLFQIIVRLRTDPQLFRHAEGARQAQGRVGRDGALAEHDLVDSAQRDADGARQRVLADVQRVEKLFSEKGPVRK